MRKSNNRIEYTFGQILGEMIFLEDAGKRNGQRLGKFKCKCGQEKITYINQVKRGDMKSCGCERGKGNITHGHTKYYSETTEYNIWENMRHRCQNENHKYYNDYGGRGIKVCKRWERFENFYEDMGKRPSLTHSLDRENNDGDYEPNNCRWATKKEQANNKRSNVIVEYKGEKKTLKEWSDKINMSYKLIWKRINTFKWTIEEAFTTPTVREKRYLYDARIKRA